MAGEARTQVEGEMKFNLPDIESDPKTFLVERIRQQANDEGIVFSGDEQMYLEMARLGRDIEAEQILEKVKQEKKFDELGRHLTELTNRAFQQDIQSDRNALAAYRVAVKALANADRWPHLSMFVSQIVFDQRFEPESSSLRQLLIALVVLVVLAFGWWIGAHIR